MDTKLSMIHIIHPASFIHTAWNYLIISRYLKTTPESGIWNLVQDDMYRVMESCIGNEDLSLVQFIRYNKVIIINV